MNLSRLILASLATLALASCVPTPPAPAPAREATPVQASFDETWNAVIDLFGNRSVPIDAIEKASGIITTRNMRVGISDAAEWADCGTDQMGVAPVRATMVSYNVLVRGDDNRSTVKVTASWTSPQAVYNCNTKGVWEEDFESAVKEAAEGM